MFYQGNSLIEKLLDALKINGEALRVATAILISLGVILILGFLMTRLTKLLKLPNVTAYILVGILIGPSVINLIPGDFIKHTDFISDIALAFIAFSAGEFFKMNVIKKSMGKVFVLCAFAFGLGISFSLLIAALSSATAPTSTIMTIKQTKAQGLTLIPY